MLLIGFKLNDVEKRRWNLFNSGDGLLHIFIASYKKTNCPFKLQILPLNAKQEENKLIENIHK